MYFGNLCHSALPLLPRLVPGRTQTSPEVKALFPLHLLPGFHEMDHINKSLVSPGLGLSSPLKRKASAHYGTTRHAKKMKALDAPDTKIRTCESVTKETTPQLLSSRCSQSPSSDATSQEAAAPALSPSTASSSSSDSETSKDSSDRSPPPSPGTTEKQMQRDGEPAAPDVETEEEKAIRLLYCSLCKVAVNSASQLQAHNSGTKHKTMLEARNGDGTIKSFPRSGVKAKMAASPESLTGLQNKTFHCEICDVHVNSETQLKQHISSRRHKDRAAGKPAKPKFSPYTSAQRHHGLQALRLALQKNHDPSKPLASCLLQRHITVAAAAVASLPPFPLQPATNSNPALFPGQTLPQALLPAAAGPICSAHTPVLFSHF